MLKILQRIGLQTSINNLPSRVISPLAGAAARFLLHPCPSYPYLTKSSSYNTKCQIKAPVTMQNGAVAKPKDLALPLDLASGMPPPEILEVSSRFLGKASENLFKNLSCVDVLDYGPNAGPQACLDQLSYFLSRRYRTGVDADWLFVMAGASQALHFLPSILGPSRGSRVFIEQPTYMHAIDILSKDFGYDIIPVETDKYGINPDGFAKVLEKSLLPKAIAESIASNRYSSILYVQTAFANPGGWSLPRERMVELEKVAEQFNVLIMADDVYSFTNFSELADMSPVSLNMLPYLPSTCTDNGELSHHIVTLGSVSKLIGPGLRFGWIVGSRRILQAVTDSGFILSGGCPNQYVASLVAEMVADGSADFLTDMVRKELKARFEIAQRIFASHLPSVVHYTMPQGGFFVWISVPKALMARGSTSDSPNGASNLVEHLRKRYGVRVIDGARCTLPPPPSKSQDGSPNWGIRVSMTALPQNDLPEALRMLCDGICDYLGFKPTV